MATNDVIAHFTCKMCESQMDEIPGIDHWGEHVYSFYKCSNPDCNNRTEDADNEIDEKMKTTYTHRT